MCNSKCGSENIFYVWGKHSAVAATKKPKKYGMELKWNIKYINMGFI